MSYKNAVSNQSPVQDSVQDPVKDSVQEPQVVTPSPNVRTTGVVKWFNNKTGYGFITINSGKDTGKDIFVHHSSINVEKKQYKYLVQGEYVEFEIIPVNNKHEHQSHNISGINGGKLMCESREEWKAQAREFKNEYSQNNRNRTQEPEKRERD
jgi:cold shock CspA family protein